MKVDGKEGRTKILKTWKDRQRVFPGPFAVSSLQFYRLKILPSIFIHLNRITERMGIAVSSTSCHEIEWPQESRETSKRGVSEARLAER